MTTTNQSIHRATVSLAIPRKNADLILYGTNVAQKLTGNASFPTPTPTVAAIVAATRDLQTAETAALSRAVGATTVRNGKRVVLVSLLQQLRGYVQGVADATPEDGAAIIESAGLAVRKLALHGKRQFAVKQGALLGTASITAVAAGNRASYAWEYSLDGGKTWIAAPITTQSKTTVAGLPSGTVVQFRYLAVTPKGGQGNWSQPLSLLVK
jgi:predicted phage tail protein